MFARERCQVEPALGVDGEQAEGSKGGQQHHARAGLEVEYLPQLVEGKRAVAGEVAEEGEMGDGGGEDLGGVVASEGFKDGRGINSRRVESRTGHGRDS